MLIEIARLMAARMSYEDLIRIAQLKLAGLADRSRTQPRSVDVRKFRLDELVSVLPAVIAEYVLDALEWPGWTHRNVKLRFSTANWFGILRLKIGARIAPVATVLGALCQGADLGRALAAHDRPQPDQAARGGVRNRADRDHDPAAMATSIARAWRIGMRSSTARQADLRRRAARCPISPAPWRKRGPRRCPIPGRPRSSARSPRSGYG